MPANLDVTDDLPSLESILRTEELTRRPSRPRDYQRENLALVSLVQAVADSPDTTLQALADTILMVCQCGSAGISLLTEDGRRFYWPAIAGVWKPHIGGGTPRDFGPCGDVLDRNCPLLFTHVERRYDYFQPVTPPVEEALLVPFYVAGRAVGTIWAIAHDDRRRFDAEDLRLLVSLGTFASAAYQVVEQSVALREQARERKEFTQDLRDVNQALLVSSLRQHELTEQADTAEAAMRVSEARRQLALDSAGLGAWHIDAVTNTLSSDERFREIFGSAAAGLTYEQAFAIIHADDRDRIRDAVAAATRPDDPAPYEAEYRVVHPDGSVRWVFARGRANFTGEGQSRRPVTFDGTIADITERRRLEDSLRASEVRYRRLFQSAEDGILILDGDSGKIIDANAFMLALVGLERDDLLGKELYEIGMFADIEENKEAFRELQQSKYLRHENLPLHNQQGERVEVEFIANVYQEDRRMVAQCNVRDISDRVAMENTIREQAKVLAGESRRKDEFLAMLSHELRNPLAPIVSAVQLLKAHERGSENPVQRQAREIIERQVANLTTLVSDLLEVSRVVSGRIHLEMQPVDLKQVVENAIETVKPLLEQRQHQLAVDLEGDPVWVQADSTRLEAVFINLLNNAAKYTDNGGHIEIRCEPLADRDEVLVRVLDDGVGMDENLLPRIFDLFTQADHSLDRSAGGLGIVLSLAHRLVDLLGGTIEAQSPPAGSAKGSEFIVRLPTIPSPETRPATTTADENLKNSDGVRVLVVDDNLDLVSAISGLLRLKGYSVQSAYTGPAGLKAVQQWRPDVVLLDIGLPGMGGYEVARRLRSDQTLVDSGESMRLIALTGYGSDADVTLAREAGFDAHLVKPYKFAELEKLMLKRG